MAIALALSDAEQVIDSFPADTIKTLYPMHIENVLIGSMNPQSPSHQSLLGFQAQRENLLGYSETIRLDKDKLALISPELALVYDEISIEIDGPHSFLMKRVNEIARDRHQYFVDGMGWNIPESMQGLDTDYHDLKSMHFCFRDKNGNLIMHFRLEVAPTQSDTGQIDSEAILINSGLLSFNELSTNVTDHCNPNTAQIAHKESANTREFIDAIKAGSAIEIQRLVVHAPDLRSVSKKLRIIQGLTSLAMLESAQFAFLNQITFLSGQSNKPYRRAIQMMLPNSSIDIAITNEYSTNLKTGEQQEDEIHHFVVQIGSFVREIFTTEASSDQRPYSYLAIRLGATNEELDSALKKYSKEYFVES